MKKVSVHAAKTQLSRLLHEVEGGTDVVIMRRGEVVARISRSSGKRRRPKVGIATSQKVTYSVDAFAPLSPDELKGFGLA